MADPWVKNPQHPMVAPELVAVLGRIVVNSGQLEAVLVTMVGALLGSTEVVRGSFGQSPLRKPEDEASRLADRLKQLAKDGMHGSTRADLISFASTSRGLFSRRNDVVHRVWGTELDSRGRYQSTAHKAGRRAFAPRELDRLADDLAAQSFRSVPLMSQITSAMPHTQQFLRDVPASTLTSLPVTYGWA